MARPLVAAAAAAAVTYSQAPILCLILSLTLISSSTLSASSARRQLPQGPDSFKFYLHNIVYSRALNNSVFTSAYSAGPLNLSQPNPYNFGVRSTFEDPITEGESASSKQIGVAQGIWVLDSHERGFVLFHVFTASITSGEHRGSICILGQVDEALDTRVLAVVGGTGDFLGARGTALNKLAALNSTLPARWTLSFHLDLYY